MPANGDGNGQEPTSSSPDSRNGQESAASQASSTRDTSDHGSSSSPNAPTNGADDKDAIIESLRREAAQRRVDAKRLAELEKREQERADADLSEKERYDKERAQWQAERAELERQRQETAIRADVKLAAQELGIKPELAKRLLDYNAIEFDEDGDPTNVAELLAKAVEEFGLAPTAAAAAASGTSSAQQPARTQQPSTPAAPAMSATNPSRGSQTIGANGRFTRGQVPSLSDPALWKRGGNN